MRRICAEAELHLASGRGARAPGPPLSGLIDPISGAAVDAACLMAQQLDAALVMVATDSGRSALALSNRRPSADILALARNDHVARALILCWGVTPVVLPEGASAEHVLTMGIDWAKTHGLVRSGQHAVLLHGEIAGRPNVRAVLAGAVS